MVSSVDNNEGDCCLYSSHDGSRDGGLRSFGSMALVVVVSMRPDVVLYHIARINFSLLIKIPEKSILKRRMICERNQTLTCEYTTRRHLPKTNLVFNF